MQCLGILCKSGASFLLPIIKLILWLSVLFFGELLDELSDFSFQIVKNYCFL